mmetsp:Transcript_21352/g.30563  ORF Transcript_21352/g.30563 Transcript_21352/m.30563 type:complete len:201 (+) Transcript_21352:176-778(+)
MWGTYGALVDILPVVFQYVGNENDVYRGAARVSRLWLHAANSNHYWREVAVAHLPPGFEIPPDAASTKEFVLQLRKEPLLQRRTEQFLMFTRVLMKYLEQKDAPMHATARAVIKNCAERHRAKVPGYESLLSVMQSQLRQTVGEVYWKKSEALLVHILKQQKQRNASSGTSQQPPVGGRPAQPRLCLVPSKRPHLQTLKR